jgi:hypothetical protein
VATFLTLLNLPALYVLWFGVKPSVVPEADQPIRRREPATFDLGVPLGVGLDVNERNGVALGSHQNKQP